MLLHASSSSAGPVFIRTWRQLWNAGVVQVSIPVDQHGEYALRWAGSALEMSWSRSLQGEPFEVFVTSTLLAKHWLRASGLPQVKCASLTQYY